MEINSKKLLALLIAMIMVMTVLSTGIVTFSEGEETLQYFTITTGMGVPGDTVSLVVSMNDVKNLKGIQGMVNYDSESLELIVADENEDGSPDGITPPASNSFSYAWTTNINNEKGYICFVGGRDVSYPATETLSPVIMTLHFKIKSGAYNGSHQISVTDYKAVKTGGETSPMHTPQAGTITITSGHAERINPVVTWPIVSPITDGQTFEDAISGGMGDGTFSIEDAEVVPEVSEIPYTKVITFVPNDAANYSTLTRPVEVIVNEAAVRKSTSAVMSVPLEGMAAGLESNVAPAPQLAADDVANVVVGLELTTMEYAISTDNGQTYGNYTSAASPNLRGSKRVKVRFLDPISGDAEFVFTPNYGDVNGDGVIDISDMMMASDISSSPTHYTPEQIIRANVSSKVDLTVDISDVILIAERATGSSTPFPIDLPPYNIGITLAAVTYQPSLTLADITLPTGLSWQSSTTLLSAPGGSYAMLYTPSGYSQSMTQYVNVTVNKADPEVIWPTPTVSYSAGLKLSDISLNEGFGWVEPNTLLSIPGGSYTMIYTPNDTVNYNVLTYDVAVTVNDAETLTTLTPNVDEEIQLVTSVTSVQTIEGKIFKLTYNTNNLQMEDLCAQTASKELAIGQVTGYPIEIIEFSPGLVRFKYTENSGTQYFSGTVNIFKFKAKTANTTQVSFRFDEI